MNTRSEASPSWPSASWAALDSMVMRTPEVAFAGSSTCSGASMMAQNAACVSASGATVTG
ncbi:hypothetical protein D3C81_1198360 [compost metagenome]